MTEKTLVELQQETVELLREIKADLHLFRRFVLEVSPQDVEEEIKDLA